MGVALIAMVAASALSAGGSIYSGVQQKKEADKQASELEAESNYLADKKREETKNLIQQQKLTYIKSGIELSPGSPLMMLADTKQKGEREAGRIREYGSKQASSLKRQGRQALTGSLFSAGSSALQTYAMGKK